MFLVVLGSVLVAAASGLAVKKILDLRESYCEITWKEYGIGMAALSAVIIPLATYAGWSIAKSNNLTFDEFLNGWEIAAVKQEITCSRDGPCRHEYDCDPYTVIVPYECGGYEGSGENSHYVSRTCYRTETRYHSCPYVDMEMTYVVATTLGNYTIADHRFPDNPQSHRWRRSAAIPDYVIDAAGVGAHPFWTQAKARIESGFPGPVTKRASYDNYILASDRTILKQYSSYIEGYLKAGLLPRLQTSVTSFYNADKVYFVGPAPANVPLWQSRLGYLNAALGTELQGDLHLVVARNERISANPDAYILALKAYWQDAKSFEKNALSKNGILVVLGTDGNTVLWGRCLTGMPMGNEMLTTAIREKFAGMQLTPEAVIGETKRQTSPTKGAQTVHGSGFLERMLWGMDEKTTRFKRLHMTGKETGATGGFEYLANEIQLTTGQLVCLWLVNLVACAIVWIVAAGVGERYRRKQYDSW